MAYLKERMSCPVNKEEIKQIIGELDLKGMNTRWLDFLVHTLKFLPGILAAMKIDPDGAARA